MQFSFLKKLLGPVNFGYTHKGFWEIHKKSAPFREHTYGPEFFVAKDGFKGGYHHESNGLDGGASRSWERLKFSYDLKKNSLICTLEAWYAFFLFENLDLVRYLGTWSTKIEWQPIDKLTVQLSNRIKSTELELFYDVGDFHIYGKVFNGYGGNGMIDYDQPNYFVSLGLALSI